MPSSKTKTAKKSNKAAKPKRGNNGENMMTVTLASVGNPDFEQDPTRKLYSAGANRTAFVSSFEEASRECRKFIEENSLGGGNWAGGIIKDKDGNYLGRVSYNGRVWEQKYGMADNDQKEIKFEDGGGVDVVETQHLASPTHVVNDTAKFENGGGIGSHSIADYYEKAKEAQIRYNIKALSRTVRADDETNYYFSFIDARDNRALVSVNAETGIVEMNQIDPNDTDDEGETHPISLPDFCDYIQVKYEDNKDLNETIWLSVDNDVPITYEEFYTENTDPDVKPLPEDDFDAIKNLAVGESIFIGGGATGKTEVKRVEGTNSEITNPHSEMFTKPLAIEFAREINQYLTPDQVAEVNRLNATPEYGNGACATHHYIDANEAMAGAWQKVMDREFNFTDPSNPHPPDIMEDVELWNNAWNLAKQNGFDVAKIENQQTNHTMSKGGKIPKSDVRHFRYIDITPTENGLQLSLNEEGIEEVNDLKADEKSDAEIWYELFDDVQGNSEYNFHANMGDSGFGLTDAEGITDGYYMGDDSEYVTDYPKSAKVYWFPDYMIKSPLDEMMENGKVVFDESPVDTMSKGGKLADGTPLYTNAEILKKYKGKFIDVADRAFEYRNPKTHKFETVWEVRGVSNTIKENYQSPEEAIGANEYAKGGKIGPIEKHWKKMPEKAAEEQAIYWGNRKTAWNKEETSMDKGDIQILKTTQKYINRYFPQFNHYLTPHNQMADVGKITTGPLPYSLAGKYIYAEVWNDFVDTDNVRHVAGWTTDDPNEEGQTIAKIYPGGGYEILNDNAFNDATANELIRESIELAKKGVYENGGTINPQSANPQSEMLAKFHSLTKNKYKDGGGLKAKSISDIVHPELLGSQSSEILEKEILTSPALAALPPDDPDLLDLLAAIADKAPQALAGYVPPPPPEPEPIVEPVVEEPAITDRQRLQIEVETITDLLTSGVIEDPESVRKLRQEIADINEIMSLID